MHEFDADLLLGGARLKHVHGELNTDQPLDGTADHLLAGKLSVDPAQKTLLEVGRRYRLAIDDGPAGPVVVSLLLNAIREPYGEAEDRMGQVGRAIVEYFDGRP